MSIVIACVKPVPLGEPAVARGALVTEGLSWGLSRGDRAVVAAGAQAAKELRAELVALAVGPAVAEAGLREALALGAARATRVDPGEAALDARGAAKALAAAVRKLGAPGAVLVGSESGDAQQGLVGPMLAELLGLDFLGDVATVETGSTGTEATRNLAGQVQRWKVKTPLVLGVAPRAAGTHPTSWGLGEATAKPLATLTLQDLGLDPAALPAAKLATMARAEKAKAEAERFEGDADDAAGQLVRRLRAGGWTR